MNGSVECNPMEQAMEVINQFGFSGMQEAMAILLNEAMKIEREKVLQAGAYERNACRTGYANGYKPKHVKSRLGELDLQIPQVRGGVKFYPSVLERGERSERAVKLALAEMYVNGVSTRKATKVMEALCGLSFSSADVSRACKLLDDELEKWRSRPIGNVVYLILDARYEKVRMNGSVVSSAVLVATAVTDDGKRSVIGVSSALNEAEIHWRNFILSLKDRGMHGIKLIVSDDHDGLKSALKSTLPGIPWQRCQVHIQRNAAAYVPKVEMRGEVATDIRNIFNAPNMEEAQRLLAKAVKKYSKTASRLASWMEDNIPDGFAVFSMPRSHRRRIRSTNMIERLNREIKRRTRVASLFPNEESLIRLVSAVLSEVSEEWESADKRYLNMEAE